MYSQKYGLFISRQEAINGFKTADVIQLPLFYPDSWLQCYPEHFSLFVAPLSIVSIPGTFNFSGSFNQISHSSENFQKYNFRFTFPWS